MWGFYKTESVDSPSKTWERDVLQRRMNIVYNSITFGIKYERLNDNMYVHFVVLLRVCGSFIKLSRSVPLKDMGKRRSFYWENRINLSLCFRPSMYVNFE